MSELWLWIGFAAFVSVMLVLDLGVFHRKAHVVSLKEAAIWTAVWVSTSLVFNAIIYLALGPRMAGYYFMGYLIEWSLSMDNVFVFAVILTYFAVPREYQHRVLFWGILSAVVFRLTFVLLGAELLRRFEWTLYLFGLLLLYTGYKLLTSAGVQVEPAKNPVIRLARRWFRVTDSYVGQGFFARVDDKLHFTPLILVLLAIETTDILFAVDSVPAIFGIFPNPREADIFIVFSSNVFAILGLRSLYFLLAGVMQHFRYLSTGLAVVLCGIGLKMLGTDLLVHRWHVPHDMMMIGSLLFVVLVLGVSIVASLIASWREGRLREATAADAATGSGSER